tara:strand:- start:43 stop:555 length:513 start_codon:yes stop_codon:yes gene_type:complete
MATVDFPVRQFCAFPGELKPFSGTQPTGTFVVSGSVSNLLINNTRTNLAADTIYTVNNGWFPGPPTTVYESDPAEGYNSNGIIVGGNESYTNTAADGRSGGSFVSCWGWPAQATQGDNEELFLGLAGYVMGTTYVTVAAAKTALISAGYYYQFPKGMAGQSPNTGDGSDE